MLKCLYVIAKNPRSKIRRNFKSKITLIHRFGTQNWGEKTAKGIKDSWPHITPPYCAPRTSRRQVNETVTHVLCYASYRRAVLTVERKIAFLVLKCGVQHGQAGAGLLVLCFFPGFQRKSCMFTHIYGEGGNPRLVSAHQPGLSKLRTVGYFFFF